MAGFILSHRKLWENPIFKGNGLRVGVWHWMLKEAAFKPTTHVVGNEVVAVARGQLCVSQSQIIEGTGIARQQLRTFLNILEKTNTISTRPASRATKGKTLITICNYDEYQSSDFADNQRPTKDQPKTNQLKKQGKKVTKDTYVSLDAECAAILSECVDPSQAAEFVAFRREMKKPMTARAARAMVERLDGHPDPTAVIRLSISNDWQGIFPDKVKRQSQLKSINGGRNDRRHQGHEVAKEIAARFGDGRIKHDPLG